MGEAFSFTMPLWEIAARSTVVYLAVLVLMRIIPKRNAGHISPNDMLILVIIGTLGTDAIIAESSTMADKLVMIGCIVLLGYVVDAVEYWVPGFSKLLRDKPTTLIEKGRMIRRNMRHEMVTEEELIATLRKAGIENIGSVRSACMEADGEISVIKQDRPR